MIKNKSAAASIGSDSGKRPAETSRWNISLSGIKTDRWIMFEKLPSIKYCRRRSFFFAMKITVDGRIRTVP